MSRFRTRTDSSVTGGGERDPRSPRRRTLPRRLAQLTAIALASGLLLTGCATSAESDVVTIRFMQNKPEVVGYYDKLITRFEAENPGIRVVQDITEASFVPSLVRGTPPDVTTRGWAYTANDFAAKGIYADLSGLDAASRVDPKMQALINSWGQYNKTEISALPFSLAASGVIYNKQIFAQFGVAIPTTWDEFIAASELFRHNGVVPIYGTFKDAWTLSQGMFDYTSGGTLDVAAFYRSGSGTPAGAEPSYARDFAPAIAKMTTLLTYTQPDAATRGYADGNTAFANGGAAMYFQGPWALSELNRINPDVQLGTFALPMTNDPADTKVRVNVDAALSILRESKHPKESARFVEFLMQPDVINAFNQDNGAFSTITDAPPQTNTQISGLNPLIASGAYYQGAVKYMPPAIPAENYVQAFALNRDGDALLRSLDDETRRVADRLTSSTSTN